MSNELLLDNEPSEPSIHEVFDALNKHLVEKGFRNNRAIYDIGDPRAMEGCRLFTKDIFVMTYLSDKADDRSFIEITIPKSKLNNLERIVMTCNFIYMDNAVSKACFFQYNGIEFHHDRMKAPSLDSFLELFDRVYAFLVQYKDKLDLRDQALKEIHAKAIADKFHTSRFDKYQDNEFLVETYRFFDANKNTIHTFTQKFLYGSVDSKNNTDALLVSFHSDSL